MRYTWDPVKDAVNRPKHGLSLADGIPALEDPGRDSGTDDRYDYGELRVVTLGMGASNILVVVSALRLEDETRIISVRRANRHEQNTYYFG